MTETERAKELHTEEHQPKGWLFYFDTWQIVIFIVWYMLVLLLLSIW